MRDACAAGLGAAAGVGLLALALYFVYLGASDTAAFAFVATLLFALVAIIGTVSLRSAGATAAGLAAVVVATIAFYGLAIFVDVTTSSDTAVRGLLFPYWLTLSLIGAGATLWARQAATADDTRAIVTASSAAFFTALLVSGGWFAYGLATLEG